MWHPQQSPMEAPGALGMQDRKIGRRGKPPLRPARLLQPIPCHSRTAREQHRSKDLPQARPLQLQSGVALHCLGQARTADIDDQNRAWEMTLHQYREWLYGCPHEHCTFKVAGNTYDSLAELAKQLLMHGDCSHRSTYGHDAPILLTAADQSTSRTKQAVKAPTPYQKALDLSSEDPPRNSRRTGLSRPRYSLSVLWVLRQKDDLIHLQSIAFVACTVLDRPSLRPQSEHWVVLTSLCTYVLAAYLTEPTIPASAQHPTSTRLIDPRTRYLS
ncbi:hypothetical protein HBH61_064880 [Parastagonospora nodorum]|nr:hypothetical protein HBH61_064880 [Parastagonospora nodorum]